MRRTLLSLIAHWAGGEIHGDDVAIDAISNDTRQMAAGSLYVALRGERFDGHDFSADAQARGASALLVERLLPLELPQVLVADSELALARIAAGMQRGRATGVFAITGSNGKTSVKTLLLGILQQHARAAHKVVYANPGNRNNEIGLPLAVIDAPEDADFAIYEMGAGKPGDIAYLTDIVRPRWALVNNIAAAHLERMGSLQGVATTKGAIYAALPADGVAVINADDAFAAWFEQHVVGRPPRCRVLRFGLEHSADVSASAIRIDASGSHFMLHTPAGDAQASLPLPGRHNIGNALAATALALAAGIPLQAIVPALAVTEPVPGRQIAHRLPNGAVLVDDSYNANPGSLDAAIGALAGTGSEGWLVLGDMRELGPDAEALHAQAGQRARQAGLKRLYTLGALSAAASAAFGDGGRHFATHDALAQALQEELHAGVRCLVKGSRGSAMDKIVKALLARGEEAPMLYELARWLQQLESSFGLFNYQTFRAILAALTSLFLSLWMGPAVIRKLAQFKGGQPIRKDGPQSHFSKAGTPTMGGSLILLSVTLAVLAWADLGNRYVWLVLAVMICFGAIGWYDDWIKIVRRDPNGLKSRWKYLLQSIFGLAAGLFLYFTADVPSALTFYIPMFKSVALPLAGISFVAIAYFWIVGFSNAVNLTDGLDGLAIMPTVLVACALGVFAYASGNTVFSSYLQIPQIPGAGELVIICAAIAGAGLGFLWFNTYPAMVFMGDIGALALGAVLGTIAVIVRQELVLVIMGGVFVIETLSVMIQVASFKLTGKRVFRMAPIHHHFELKGWPEPRVIVRFWIISVVLVLVGLATLKVR